MKTVYLDKKERVLAWFTPARSALLGVVALALLFVPLWPDFVDGRFALEPVRRTLVHAEVPEPWRRYSPMKDSRSQPADPCCDCAMWTWNPPRPGRR